MCVTKWILYNQILHILNLIEVSAVVVELLCHEQCRRYHVYPNHSWLIDDGGWEAAIRPGDHVFGFAYPWTCLIFSGIGATHLIFRPVVFQRSWFEPRGKQRLSLACMSFLTNWPNTTGQCPEDASEYNQFYHLLIFCNICIPNVHVVCVWCAILSCNREHWFKCITNTAV